MAIATQTFDLHSSSPKTWRPLLRRLWVGASVAFALVIVALYAQLANRVGFQDSSLRAAYQALPAFFWVQLAGFGAVPLLISAVRPAAGGRAVQIYLAASTAFFLAQSQHFRIPLAFGGFALWCLCSANTLRAGIRRFAGVEFAGWGVACAALVGVLTAGCFFLALGHAMTRPLVSVLALLLAAPGAVDLIRSRSTWLVRWRRPGLMGPLEAAFCEAIWLPLALTFVWACADEVFSDSSRVHLPYARQVMIEGGLPTQVAGDWFRLTPKPVELVYAAAATASSFRLAKWLSWAALAALAVLMAEETGRPRRDRAAYLFAAAATLGCPLLLWEASSLYIDHVATLTCAAAFFVLVRAVAAGNHRAVCLAAALMGAGVQIKYPVLVAGGVWCVLAIVLLVGKYGGKLGAQRSLIALVLFTAVAAPWFVRTWWVSGNPVFPFFNGVFGSPFWRPEFGTDFNLEIFRPGPDIWSRLALPWTVTFQTSRLLEGVDGWLGVWLLAFLPFLAVAGTAAAKRGPRATRQDSPDRAQPWILWFAGAAIVAAVGLKTFYVRYWLCAYPLLLLPLLQGIVSAARWRIGRIVRPYAAVLALAGMLLPTAVWLGVWWFESWAVYTRQITRPQWLANHFQGMAAVDDLNAQIDPRDGVLCLNYNGISTIKARAVEMRDTSLGVAQVENAAELPDFFQRERIRYFLVNHSRPILVSHREFDCNGCYDDEKLFSASQGVAIYDLRMPAGASRFVAPVHRHIPPTLSTGGIDHAAWSGSAKLLAEFGEGPQTTLRIDTALEQSVWHNFFLPSGTTLFRCQLPLRGDQSADCSGCVRLTVEWFDAQWNKLASETCECLPIGAFPTVEARRHTTGGQGPYGHRLMEDLACIYSRVPPGAVSGAVLVNTWRSRVWIQTACMTFWSERAQVRENGR